MSLTLYFLRHGQTALSRDDVFCGSGLDPELTPEGLQMAHAFAAAYRAKPWLAVFNLCNELSTRPGHFVMHGITLRRGPDLNDRYGQWKSDHKK